MRTKLIQAALKFLSFLPLRISHWLGVLAGLALYLLPNRMRHITDVNLTACYPKCPLAWRKRTARMSLIETGKSVTEAPYLWRASPARIAALVKHVTGKALMDEAVAQSRGVILAAPHLGSWEFCGLYSATCYAITSLYRPPRLKGLETIMRAGRENTGANLLPTGAQGIKGLLKALASGECVGILPDQVPNRGNGVHAPFFGIDAYTMMLITRLAGKRRIPVILIYAQRLRGGQGFHVHYAAAPREIYDPDPVAAAAALNRGVESLVRECPEQYAWSYKRFKNRPPGAQSIY
jgi:Kdo2-lipid IVA lauroyltransferase/acyltransferase